MKRKYLAAAGIVLLLILAAGLIHVRTEQEQLKGYSEDYVAMKELPGQMSFTYYEKPEWEELIGGINGRLTYGKLESLLEKLSLESYITYEAKMSFQAVPRKEWNQIYKQILDLLDVEQTVTVTDVVFIDGEIKDGKMLTQEGSYKVSEAIAPYFEKYDVYEVYQKGREIIGVKSISEKEVVWKNVFVHKTEKEKAQILYENQKISVDTAGLKETIRDTICDIVWKNNQISAIYKKEEMIQGKVLSFNENQIEISGYGTLEYEGKMRIYKTYGTVEQLDESKLIIGNLQADFVVAEKKVCGIILKQPAEIKSIRVLLLNEGQPYWESASFVSEVDCTVAIGKKQQTIPAGQVITAESLIPEDSSGYVKITPKEEQGQIYRSDTNGTKTFPGYQGSMEIRKYPEGLGVVNELLLEQYLYGVVPSEMPAAYETEALRAQAVCARSYAYMQLMKGDYAAFAAHVDDSTNYQVYNKQEEMKRQGLQ